MSKFSLKIYKSIFYYPSPLSPPTVESLATALLCHNISQNTNTLYNRPPHTPLRKLQQNTGRRTQRQRARLEFFHAFVRAIAFMFIFHELRKLNGLASLLLKNQNFSSYSYFDAVFRPHISTLSAFTLMAHVRVLEHSRVSSVKFRLH